jgi:dCTP deaminase
MILTDREIQISLAMNQISVEPPPGPAAFSSTSLDLTLDAPVIRFKEPKKGVVTFLDPAVDGYDYSEAITEVTEAATIGNEGYVVEPGVLVLMWTREYIKLPSQSRIAARVEGKSSLARLGLGVHVTAPIIHAGFSGPIQLEVFNHGGRPVKLRVGMRICQLIFEQTLGVANKGYAGQFLDQHA